MQEPLGAGHAQMVSVMCPVPLGKRCGANPNFVGLVDREDAVMFFFNSLGCSECPVTLSRGCFL